MSPALENNVLKDVIYRNVSKRSMRFFSEMYYVFAFESIVKTLYLYLYVPFVPLHFINSQNI